MNDDIQRIWNELKEACESLTTDNFMRGALMPELEEAAKESQGESLAKIRQALAQLAPKDRPEQSVAVDQRLLDAADYISTADPFDEGEVREGLKLMDEALNPSTRLEPVEFGSIEGSLPTPFLSVVMEHESRTDGAVLSEGTVAVLAGAGGSAKSSLALQLAIASSGTSDDGYVTECGTAIRIRGARTLMVLYEDSKEVMQHKGRKVMEHMGRQRYAGAEGRLHLLDMMGRPIYGTTDSMRAEPLSGWDDLWAAVDKTEARFIVIDPVLAAYVGESNSAGPVREFLSALTEKAAERKAAVLLIAHSTKAARYGGDPFDPGQIGGSGHWSDGVRGAMSLTRDHQEDRFRLAVVKANYGPAYVSNPMEPIHPPDSKMIIGLRGEWSGWKFAGTEQANGRGTGRMQRTADEPGAFIGAEAYSSRRTRAEQRRVYASLEWLFARGQALQRDGYRCQRCARPWRLEVHHKHSLRDGGAAFDLENLTTLCARCHEQEHPTALDRANGARHNGGS